MKPFFLLFTLLFAVYLKADNLNFRQVSVEEGVAHTDVTSIVQDSIGYIYMGTYSGLTRFDGKEIVNYRVTEQGLNNVYFNRILSLLLDENENLWIGTQGGIIKFNLLKQRFEPLKNVSNGETGFQIEQTFLRLKNENALWATQDGKALVFDVNGDSLKSITNLADIFDELKGEQVLNISSDFGSGVWIHSLNGLFYCSSLKLNDAKLNKVVSYSDLGLQSINSGLLYDKENNLWVLSQDGLGRMTFSREGNNVKVNNFKFYDIESLENAPGSGLLPISDANYIYKDSKSDLWISTFSGLIKLEKLANVDNFRFFLYQEDQYNPMSLGANKVNQLIETRDGTIFVGTFGGGFNYFEQTPKPFNTLRPFSRISGSSFSKSFVRAVYEKGNQLWIGTVGSGIVVYDLLHDTYKTIDTSLPKGKRLSDNNIRSIIEDNDGRIWVATLGGINIIDNNFNVEHIVSHNTTKTIPVNAVQNLAMDRFGRVWAGFWFNDLTCIEPISSGKYKFTYYTEGNGKLNVLSNFINSIYSDFERNELIVASNQGINRIIFDTYGDVKEIKAHRSVAVSKNSLHSNYIWPIQKYNDSTYYLGTLGGGFSKVVFSEDSMYVIKTLTTQNGAPFDDVECLQVDNNGKIWIAGAGLSRYDPVTENFWNFDIKDGLQGRSFKIGGSHKGRSGRLYFGGTKGMTYFYPNEITKNIYFPKPGFTSLHVHNRLVEPGEELFGKVILEKEFCYTKGIVLNQKHNEFSISFSGFHYANPDKNSFRYKLEGYDEEWKFTDSDNSRVFYSNLPQGNYRLLLEAYNNDGLKAESISGLDIRILPPWWKSPLAFVAYFLLLIISIFIAYRLFFLFIRLKNNLELKEVDEKKKEEMHQMKLRFFTNISHELRTPLSLILSPVERLNGNNLSPMEKKKYLNIISRNVNRILQLVNELLDFRKAEAGTMGLRVIKNDLLNFIEEITIGFSEMARAKNISLDFSSENCDRFVWFDPRHVEKIAYNLLSNALKNTMNGGSVSVKITNELPGKSSYRHSFQVEGNQQFEKYIYLVFSDSGVGITEKSLPEIFNRFYQVEEVTGEKHLGTGIGLAYVKSLVLVHKGKITVSSERDKGTEFVLALPIGDNCYSEKEKEKEVSTSEEFIKKPTTESPTIEYSNSGHDLIESFLDKKLLVVEDNDEVRHFIRDEFSTKFTVIEAFDGVDAFTKMQTKPDIIITDVMMPRMDGVEFTRKLKADDDLRHIPVIMLTARTNIEQEELGLESGADLYLRKPFSIRLLELYVRNLLMLKKEVSNISDESTYREIRSIVKNEKERAFFERALAIIISHLDDTNFSVDDLVSEIAMGRTMFYQRIKQVSGISAKELIRAVRMKKAAELLATSDVTISEVKDMVGFGSMSHFTQCFKKYYNCTPSEYIKKYEN